MNTDSDQKLIEELYKASKDGHHEKVLQLLQRGVPPDSKYYEREQRSYRSPLYISCWFNRRQSAEYLLKWGASVATTLEGSIPLHGASSNNSIDCVKLLLEHHCPTDIKNSAGNTAVDLAKGYGYKHIIDVITSYKPSPRDPLDTYPTVKMLSELKVDSWFKLGLQLGLADDQLESLKDSPQPTAATLIAAKVQNIDLNWRHVVESLLLVGECKMAETVCNQQGVRRGNGQVSLPIAAGLGWMEDIKQRGKRGGSEMNPVHLACANGHLEIAGHLISKSICDVKDAVLSASSSGYLDTLKYLEDVHHCDPRHIVDNAGDTPLSLASANGHLGTVKYLVEAYYSKPDGSGSDWKPLFLACVKGHLQIASYLISKKICKVEDAVTFACAKGHLDTVKYLVDVHHCDPRHSVSKTGDTPLSMACANGRLDTIKHLVEVYHCDPRRRVSKTGHTPLSLASANGHLDTVKYLVKDHHCDLEYSLIEAVKHDQPQVAKFLLEECHSDPNVKDKEGRSPLNFANVPEITILLLKHGAKADNVYKSHSKLIGKLSSERPPDNPLPIFITGDGGVGKSTVLQSILSSKGFRAIFVKAKPVTGVDEKTVGIIPKEIVTKEFGRVIWFDFAGQQEFYASHCAVLENAVQTSPPIVIYLAHLQASEQKVAVSTHWWMTLVQNQCTNLTGAAHVIVVGSHADKVLESGENPRDKESMFAPIIKKFSKLEFTTFIPMDCRFADSDQIKELKKQIQKSSAILRSPETVSLNAHTFYIYLFDSFKNNLAVSLNDVRQRIHSDLDQTESKRAKNLLSFIPSTLARLVEICDQLSKKGLILYLHNEASPEKSFIVCDRVGLLSEVTGTVFAPENFRQHCSLASSTGVVPFTRFTEKFQKHNIEMLAAFMSHLELCFEIFDKEVLICVRKLDENPEPDSRYLFFPGLIRIDNPQHMWEEDSDMNFFFGWILECSEELQFFDPRCLQVLILRLVFSFGLAPARNVQKHVPSLQRFCSVWKNGLCWCNDDGVTSYLELSDSGRSFILKMRSIDFQHDILAHRSKIISKVLKTVADFCPNVTIMESVIDPKQVVRHPLPSSSDLTLFGIKDFAKAIIAVKDVVKSTHRAVSIKHVLRFEPYAGLDQDTLLCIHSDKNVKKDKKVSNSFISHFADQVADLDLRDFYVAILNSSFQASVHKKSLPDSFRQNLLQAFSTWRNQTEGTYSCLRKTLNKYSIFTERNPLVLAGVAHSEFDPSIFPESPVEDFQQEPGPDQLPLTEVEAAIVDMRADWYTLAVELSIDYGTRRAIEKNHSSVEERFHALLKHWVSRPSHTPTWGSLIKALQSAVIDRRDLAEKVKLIAGDTNRDDAPSTSTLPSSQSPNEPLNIEEHLKMVRDLTWPVRASWYSLGEQLTIDEGTRKAINDNHQHTRNFVDNCFTTLLETWLTQTPPPTWAMLIEALKTPVVNRADIASNIEHIISKN